MKKIFKVAILGMLALTVFSTPVMASNNGINPRLSFDYQWMDTPRDVEYYCSFSGWEKTAVQNAMNTWNRVRGIDGNKMVTMVLSSNRNAECQIYYTGSLGREIANCQESVSYDSVHKYGIIDGMTITINQNMNFSNGASPNAYDLQSIVLHELGHSVAIRHCHEIDAGSNSCNSPTCSSNVMNPEYSTNSTRRVLQDYDIASYQYIYWRDVYYD